MATVNKLYYRLEDDKRVHDLSFLSDITGKVNELNLQFQGKNKILTELVSDVNALKGKLTFLEAQLRRGDLKQFENMVAKSIDKNSL